ncbi:MULTISPECIES: NAD(P)-dependent oxidoreductase [Bacillus]|uniref:NAD(P)-dependent oxidoreductase n=1 Tax=Bacillus rugosus TaxID=2715209 RepID=A0ACD3ZYG1_9BACI|nr:MULTISPECIES: NAD(P)-dependent oxidoreductase [Bacillus]MBY4602886.1 NAD(P)-dependent oxidoreductase [Bacillus sp. SPARC3]UPV78974.1 NAD(P)-dependent oxidoreductase [Bacillus rugosus]
MKIGWIGAGILGSAVLKKISNELEVYCWNRSIAKVDDLTHYGVSKVDSLEELATKSNIIFLCIKGEDSYKDILFNDKKGIANFLSENTIIVDLSTISPKKSMYLKQKLSEYNLKYVECPVSGGPEKAIQGNLTAIMSGDPVDINIAKMVVGKFCSQIHYVGDIGKGQLIKLINNLAESINLLAAAEVINIGLYCGIDLKTLNKVLPTTRGYSVYMGVLLDRLINPSENISASLDVRLKDIELANQLAKDNNLSAPLGTLTQKLFEFAQETYGPNRDQTECMKLYNVNFKGD